MNILLVDDYESLTHLWKEYILARFKNISVDTCSSLSEFLKLKNKYYDIIFLDWSLSTADNGVTAAKIVNEASYESVYLVTAFCHDKEVRRFVDNHNIICLEKPIEFSKIMELIKIHQKKRVFA